MAIVTNSVAYSSRNVVSLSSGGVGRAMLLPAALREISLLDSSDIWGLKEMLVLPWLVATSPQSLPPSSMASSVSFLLFMGPLYRTLEIGYRAHPDSPE